MAAAAFWIMRNRRQARRTRPIPDRSDPFVKFNEIEIYQKFRFPRQELIQLLGLIEPALTQQNRGRLTLSPMQQLLLTLRYFATSTFMDVTAELLGVSKSSVSRVVSRVTDALFEIRMNHILFPDQAQANHHKVVWNQAYGFPNAFACIDGTQVRITKPHENEHEFVNRKGYHAINVQVRNSINYSNTSCVKCARFHIVNYLGVCQMVLNN